MQRISIREVAAHAEVSPSTVSRVLNGHEAHHMRPETKERVLAAIKELHYTPVKAAQRLRRQRTHALGILVPDITNLYFALLTRGVESVAFDREFTTLICDSNHNPRRETRYLDMLLSEDVEGVLYVPVGQPDRATVRRLLARGVRMMLVDRRAPNLPTVEADNRSATRDLVKHILGLGYRRIAYAAGPADVSTAEDRLAGFRDALAEAGIEPAGIHRGSYTFESGRECGGKILDGHGADAIVAANDLMAFGVLRAVEERGLAVPQDLGVAGFDHIPHIPYATFMHPELTTVEVPAYEMGREAATRLLDGCRDGVYVTTRLIPGGTCRRQERSHP